MKLSIIIPTKGRESIKPLLWALTPQLNSGDEIIVVQGVGESVEGFCKDFENVKYLRSDKVFTPSVGATERNIAMKQALGSHLSFIDDDDRVSDNYMSVLRQKVNDNKSIHVFKLQHSHKEIGVIWKEKRIKFCNISTQMFVVPNSPILPNWTEGSYETDFLFISMAEVVFPSVVWHEDIIAFHNGGVV